MLCNVVFTDSAFQFVRAAGMFLLLMSKDDEVLRCLPI